MGDGAMTTLSELEGSAAWRTLQEPRVLFHLSDGHTISFWAQHLGKAEEFGDANNRGDNRGGEGENRNPRS
jgi:hypothetical protein